MRSLKRHFQLNLKTIEININHFQSSYITWMHHGGVPEKDLERLTTLKTDVLGVFASNDKWINKVALDQFKNDFNELDIQGDLLVYGAEQAFANPSNPN
jgi:dienelactone hydrolase